jgi:hypothetical protein
MSHNNKSEPHQLFLTHSIIPASTFTALEWGNDSSGSNSRVNSFGTSLTKKGKRGKNVALLFEWYTHERY